MRKTRTIIFYLVLLLEVCFCFWSGQLSLDPIQHIFTELPDQNNNASNSLISEKEPVNEDQNPQTYIYCQFREPILRMPTIWEAFLIPNSYHPIWQPPKL